MKYTKKSLIMFLAVIISILLISCEKNTQIDNASNAPVKTETLGVIKIHYIDVGQGDSELIQIDGKNILIDAGTSDKKAFEYLKSVGVTTLDYVIATHPHKDHIGSMDNVIDDCSVGTFYAPQVSTTTKAYENMRDSLLSKNIKFTVPKVGDQITIGNAVITFLSPNSDTYEDLNNYSIVIKLKYGNNSFVFMGDAQALSENEMLTRQLDVQADVLKVGQHGSDTSTMQEFLNKVNPKYAVISCGKDDSYQHPNQTTIEKLNAKNIEVFRTDLEGTVIATSNGKDITFNVNH
jgi:competence protein ComEC